MQSAQSRYNERCCVKYPAIGVLLGRFSAGYSGDVMQAPRAASVGFCRLDNAFKANTRGDVRVYFELSVAIARPPSDVFAFLRDKDLYPQQADSPVLALEKTTVGATGVGTRYREVVQMLPQSPLLLKKSVQ
jgi:hypothetical protein